MRPVRTFALAVAAAGPLATGGCGMYGLFDTGPSTPRSSGPRSSGPRSSGPRSSGPQSSTPATRPATTSPRQEDEAPPVPAVSVADKLSGSDRTVIDKAAARALARGTTGEPVAWRNAATGTVGSITPTSPAYRGQGRKLCRDYQLTVRLGSGQRETLVGTRCRASGGRWAQSS